MKTITRRHVISTGLLTSILVSGATPLTVSAQVTTANSTPLRSVKIQIVLFDKFEVTDALAPFDAFKIAEHIGAPIETSLVTVNGATQVTALDSVVVKPTRPFDLSADLLLVPGSPPLWNTGPLPDGLADALKRWHQAGKTIATVCTGAVLVARTGLLKG